MNFIEDFIKRAQDAGLTQEQAEQFVHSQLEQVKQAEAQELDKFISGILKSAQVEKTEESAAYVEGVLKAAVESGCTVQQAAEISKIALEQVKLSVQKTAAAKPTPELVSYANEFLKAAAEAGLDHGQSVDLLKIAIQKQSNDPGLLAQVDSYVASGGSPDHSRSALGGASSNVLEAILGGKGSL